MRLQPTYKLFFSLTSLSCYVYIIKCVRLMKKKIIFVYSKELKDLLDAHINLIQKKSFSFSSAGENVILNRETEIVKQTLWSRGIYRRALECFQTLKLKSGATSCAA